MTGAPKTSNDRYECGACLHEAKGYTKAELEADGWTWHRLTGGMSVKFFILCGTCTELYARRRQAKATTA